MSLEIIGLAVMRYIRFPLSLWQAGDLLHERDVDIRHEIVSARWNRFGSMFAAEIRTHRTSGDRSLAQQSSHEFPSAVPVARLRDGKFQAFKSLQKLTSTRSSIHNHFNQ